MKKLGIAVLVVVVLIAAALFYLRSNLDRIVAQLIERVGTETLGTAVHVGEVELDLGAGRLDVRKLTVANPEGFSGEPAISLGDIGVQLDVESARTLEPLVLRELTIGQPVVHFELDSMGRANLNTLREHADRAATQGPVDPEAEPAGAAAVKVRVLDLTLRDGRVDADTTAVGGEKRSFELPSVELRDVGGEGGTSAGRVAQVVVTALAEQAAEAAARERLEGYTRRKVQETVEEELGESGAAEAADAVNRGLESAVDEVKGLLE